ncbi:3-mercaptopyruvate sulfurtransferase [Pararhizobium haloflavum]|uniref:3-mercaptopyruvate sulfurtransferase n=1 Tax=Pararhizobium haloflavum TaxID=2037914 RepID=UPI000C18A6B5|nr:3-mercaptopyruvate sulfurtransferase [Pararhizobium haloflavum]
MSEVSRFVIEPEALGPRLGEPRLKIVDASWYLPAQARDAKREYDAAHIPGAVFFDHDRVVDPSSPLPHTVPTAEDFSRHMRALGLSNEDEIVVYDGIGMFTAPRLWWLLTVMGARNVRVLNGGFDAWRANGHPVTDRASTPAPGSFEATFNREAVATLADMRRILDDGSAQIADARSHGRFTGEEPEPRAGMRSGHMPGAANVPVFSLSTDGRLKDLESLRTTLRKAGLDPAKPVVTTCGSGITAAVITLALYSLGHEDNRLYDGSWSEWGAREDTPVKKGHGILDEAASSLKE